MKIIQIDDVVDVDSDPTPISVWVVVDDGGHEVFGPTENYQAALDYVVENAAE